MRLLHSLFISQSLIIFSHLPLCNTVFRPRTLFVRLHRLRASKSLVDDEAELSNWVDDFQTGCGTADAIKSGSARGKAQRSSVVSRGSGLGERRGGDFNSKRRFPLRSDSSDAEDVPQMEKYGCLEQIFRSQERV
ncbi:hypothetical protein RYX36_001058 [Vicia faba]